MRGHGNFWHSYSLRIFNMEEQTLIRKIDSMSSDVHLHGNILMTYGPRISWPGLSYQSYARFTDLGVKVRNMKMDFNTGSSWRRVGQ